MSTEKKIANPAPLGLLGFGMSTILLNLHNLGVIPLSIVIIAMGIAMGGLALAEIAHYLAVGPNVEEDVEDHHHEFEEEDKKDKDSGGWSNL